MVSTVAPLDFAVSTTGLMEGMKAADGAATTFKGVGKAADEATEGMNKAAKAAKQAGDAHKEAKTATQGHIEAYKSAKDVISELTKTYGSLGKATEEAVQAANKGLKGQTGFEVLTQWRKAVNELAAAHKDLADHAERAGRATGQGGHGGHGSQYPGFRTPEPHAIRMLLNSMGGVHRYGPQAVARNLGEIGAEGALGGLGLGQVAAAGGIALGVGFLAEKTYELAKEAQKAADEQTKLARTFVAIEGGARSAAEAVRAFNEQAARTPGVSGADYTAGASALMRSKYDTGLSIGGVGALNKQLSQISFLSGNQNNSGLSKLAANAMSDGRISLDELNRMLDDSPDLARALGGDVGASRRQAASGQLTADAFIAQINRAQKATDDLAAHAEKTFGESWGKAGDAFHEMLAGLARDSGWNALNQKLAEGTAFILSGGRDAPGQAEEASPMGAGGRRNWAGFTPPRNNLQAMSLLESIFGQDQVVGLTGYRSPEHNREVHGVAGDAHEAGLGYDFRVRGLNGAQIVERLRDAGIPLDQAIAEGRGGHIGFGTVRAGVQFRNQFLTRHGDAAHATYTPFDTGAVAQADTALAQGGTAAAQVSQLIAQAQQYETLAQQYPQDARAGQWRLAASRLRMQARSPLMTQQVEAERRAAAMAGGARGGAIGIAMTAGATNDAMVAAGFAADPAAASALAMGNAVAGFSQSTDSMRFATDANKGVLAKLATGNGADVNVARAMAQAAQEGFGTFGNSADPAARAAIQARVQALVLQRQQQDLMATGEMGFRTRISRFGLDATARGQRQGLEGYDLLMAGAGGQAEGMDYEFPDSGRGDAFLADWTQQQIARAGTANYQTGLQGDALDRRLGIGAGAGARVAFARSEQRRAAMLAAPAGNLRDAAGAGFDRLFARQDQNTIKDIRDADAERVSRLKEQLGLMGQVGDKYELESRLLTDINALQDKGVTITEELRDAERKRLEAVMEVEKSYERQLKQQTDLMNVSRNAGRNAGLGLRGLASDALDGKLTGRGVLDAFSSFGKNTALDLLQATVFDKVENKVEDSVEGLMGRLFNGRGGQGGKGGKGLIGSLVSGLSGRDMSLTAEGSGTGTVAAASNNAASSIALMATSADRAAAALSKLGGGSGGGGDTLSKVLSIGSTIFGGFSLSSGKDPGKGLNIKSDNVSTGHAFGDILDRPTQLGGGHYGGEAGYEAVVPLKRGPDGRLGVASQGGGEGGVQIIVNDMRSNRESSPVQTHTSRQPNGRRMVRMTIRDEVRAAVSDGSMDPALSKQYGITHQVARR